MKKYTSSNSSISTTLMFLFQEIQTPIDLLWVEEGMDAKNAAVMDLLWSTTEDAGAEGSFMF